jgi:hypothetical protein
MAPSTTLGDKSLDGMLDGMLRYGVAGLRRDGTWAVGLRQVGRLVEASEVRCQPLEYGAAAI